MSVNYIHYHSYPTAKELNVSFTLKESERNDMGESKRLNNKEHLYIQHMILTHLQAAG